MKNRASTSNLVLSLVAFAVFMMIVLSAVGFGAGVLEMTLWLALVVVGAGLILRRYLRTRSEEEVSAVRL